MTSSFALTVRGAETSTSQDVRRPIRPLGDWGGFHGKDNGGDASCCAHAGTPGGGGGEGMPSASEASRAAGSRVRVAAAQVGCETSQVEWKASCGRDNEEDTAAAPWGE